MSVPEIDFEEEIEFTFFKNNVHVYCNKMAARDDGGWPLVHYYISNVESSDAGIEPPKTWTVYNRTVWNSQYFEAEFETITFTSEQEVSKEFYEWFTVNATKQ